MNGKMAVGVGLILSLVLPISLLLIPTLADVNGTENGEQIQDQERLGVRDGSCNGDMMQERERSRLHEQDCNGDCVGSQHRNRVCNNEASLEQHRYQNREGMRKQGS